MMQPLEDRIKEAFANAYQPPAADLRRMLLQPAGRSRPRGQRLLRVGALALVAGLVAAAISLPRTLGPAPHPISSHPFSQVFPDYGYVVVATIEDLSGRGGKVYLGVVPPGRGYGVLLQTRCAARTLGSFSETVAGGQVVKDFLIGISSASGHVFSFYSAPSPADHTCAADNLAGGGTQIPGQPLNGDSKPQRLYVIAAKGIAWRATLEVYGSLGSPPQLPATLGTCRSSGLGWGSDTPGRTDGTVAVTLQPSSDYPTGKAPCQLQLPVRLGLFWAGTTTPLSVAGNLSTAPLAGRYDGGPAPSLTFRWSNWCGPRRPVQEVFFGPGGAVLIDSTAPVKLPLCQDQSRPSRLAVSSAG
jgi:hypothetical protein